MPLRTAGVDIRDMTLFDFGLFIMIPHRWLHKCVVIKASVTSQLLDFWQSYWIKWSFVCFMNFFSFMVWIAAVLNFFFYGFQVYFLNSFVSEFLLFVYLGVYFFSNMHLIMQPDISLWMLAFQKVDKVWNIGSNRRVDQLQSR